MREKGEDVWSVSPDATVFEAIQVMAEKGVGALLVMEWSRLVGIISERDYTRKIVLKDRSSRATKVRDIMTEKVIHVTPDTSIDECMILMSDNYIRHLPVLDGDRVVGVMSVKDVLHNIISEKQSLIQQLESYITGTA
jgi:CBS domain-containing protein